MPFSKLCTPGRILAACVALTAAGTTAKAALPVWPNISFNPAALNAGGGAQSLSVGVSFTSIAANWNGQPRPVVVPPSTGFTNSPMVQLTADDLAVPQLGILTLNDKTSGTLLATLYVPVILNVNPAGIAVDRKSGRLYIATPSTAPSDKRFPPNALIAIDTSTGQFTGTLQMTGPLGVLALSDDGSTLYSVLNSSTIQQIDTAQFAVIRSFAVPKAPLVTDIAVMPGAPQTIAVAFGAYTGASTQTVMIFDSGVARPNQVTQIGYVNLTFSPDGNYLFQSGNYAFLRYPVDASGVGTPVSTGIQQGPAVSTIAGNNLILSNGLVFDWRTLSPVFNLGVAGAFAADSTENRIFAAVPYGQFGYIQAFDLSLPAALGQQLIGPNPGSEPVPSGSNAKFFRFGTDGLVLTQSPPFTGGYVLVFHTPVAGPAPSVAANAVVSSASFGAGAIAPGELISIFGSSLWGDSVWPMQSAGFSIGPEGAVVPPVGNVEVWFGNHQGTVLFTSAGQVNAIAPFELEPGTTVNFQLWNSGIPSAQIPLTVVSASPALFTRDGSGKGLAAIVNQDGSINAPSPPGSVVTLFGTGGGLAGADADGKLAFAASLLAGSVQATIGGANAQVIYAGAAPELVNGVFQINLQVPDGLAPGTSAPVFVTVNGQTSPQGVSIAIR